MQLVELLATTEPWATTWQPHPWQCWPPDTRILYWHRDQQHLASAVFDTEGRVLALELYQTPTVRWVDPQYARAFQQECLAQGIDPNEDEQGAVLTVSSQRILAEFLAAFQQQEPLGPAAAD
jgi:hypothetical protein